VEPFLAFLGSYWWLAFPLAAGLGGVGKAWERAAKRRHERRIEIIRAKGELSAARAAMGPASGAASGARPASHRDQLAQLFATHNAVVARWLEYELDVAKLIAFPAMSDGRQPLTAGFLRAKKHADNLRPGSERSRVTDGQLNDYRNAVTEFEVAFDLAERDARRVRDSSFSPSERKRLDTAKQLLSVAVDQAATPAERQVAYKRVREELDGLIAVSDEAMEVLETKVALELEPGQTPRGDAAGHDEGARP
jgi:hypothetical protein